MQEQILLNGNVGKGKKCNSFRRDLGKESVEISTKDGLRIAEQ